MNPALKALLFDKLLLAADPHLHHLMYFCLRFTEDKELGNYYRGIPLQFWHGGAKLLSQEKAAIHFTMSVYLGLTSDLFFRPSDAF